ncbi:hypothetical protein F0562_016150 [Nyssa sinensis]|uniref:ABC-type xenobiotic transporter n=1 Tax=Nyssa sinensis TaxID=561372 RepID=A0A5J4ZLY6_9ASTE|nr:hypothetical protein F0562_016150 [Nyssa sinensis]
MPLYSIRNSEQKDLSKGVLLVGCLVVVKAVESLSQRHWYFDSRRSGMRMRSALMVAIYKKQLKLSNQGRRRHSSGEIVNYIGVDAYRMGEFFWWFHTAWSLVLQLLLSIGVLSIIVGLGALPSLAPLLIVGLLNVPIARTYNNCQSQFMVAQDERLRATSEVLNNMKIVKLQSWEEKFNKVIDSLRVREFKWLAESQIKKAYLTALYWMSPTVVSTVVFVGCELLKSAPLNAATIFTILAVLRNMCEPVRTIPEALSVLIQVKVSLDRLNAFLLDDELNDEDMRFPLQNSDISIRIQSGSFSWEPESAFPAVRDVNLEVKRGQKVAVCGAVGAGKSSLLHAILGEVSKISGSVNVIGSTAARYLETIKACALDKDINSFYHGDLTEIGQRGLNLSGGQKQRIQLARAVYNDADIYLLDDPFSAVDAHTAAILFNDCVMNALANKTVILVTHQVEFLSEADKILVMEGGRVIQSGRYEELLTSGTAFEELVNAHNNAVVSSNSGNQVESQEMDADQLEESCQTHPTKEKNGREILVEGIPGIQLTKEEETAMGDAASTYWLGNSHSNSQNQPYDLDCNLCWNVNLEYIICISKVGRIFTRVSSDMSTLDFGIPFAIAYFVSAAVDLLVTIAVIASITWPVLIVAAPAILTAIYVQGYYLSSARELIRINGATKAPIMNYAAETSLGVVSIRAFNMAEKFFEKYLKLVDTDARLFFHSNAATEWLLLRVEALQNLILLMTSLLLILLPQGYFPSGLVGLSLSYALSLNTVQVIMTRWYCNLANYIISVERIKQFMHIPAEPPAIVNERRPPASWPSHGRIELQDLKVRYRPNAPLVLKGIDCTFKEGARVGVVGRTGSGKTTLISALFRLVEPDGGRILIDGVDICSIGLKDLRVKLSIIPQEPTLFRGSIRSNLDPLGMCSDNEIWEAIEKCQLKATISSLPNLLDSSVSDEGENWSVGQRQLLCLGRVLLKRNRILVLDEATASIDAATDAIVQRIIRKEFLRCTVITIAHRVPTVTDSDMVMVLSSGEVLEYDVPSKLMETNSSFSRLVAEYWTSCRRNSIKSLCHSH